MNSGGGLFSQVENALGTRSTPPAAQMPPAAQITKTYTSSRTQDMVAPATIALAATKTNTPRQIVLATNKPMPEPPVQAPEAAPEEWTPLLAAYVEPKDANNLWPIFLIMLLVVLTVELMRRHRRRRKRRHWVPNT